MDTPRRSRRNRVRSIRDELRVATHFPDAVPPNMEPAVMEIRRNYGMPMENRRGWRWLLILVRILLILLLLPTLAAESNFRIRTRYDDNDYSNDNRDVIVGMRMSFVPPKSERISKEGPSLLRTKRTDEEPENLPTTPIENKPVEDPFYEEDEDVTVGVSEDDSRLYDDFQFHSHENILNVRPMKAPTTTNDEMQTDAVVPVHTTMTTTMRPYNLQEKKVIEEYLDHYEDLDGTSTESKRAIRVATESINQIEEKNVAEDVAGTNMAFVLQSKVILYTTKISQKLADIQTTRHISPERSYLLPVSLASLDELASYASKILEHVKEVKNLMRDNAASTEVVSQPQLKIFDENALWILNHYSEKILEVVDGMRDDPRRNIFFHELQLEKRAVTSSHARNVNTSATKSHEVNISKSTTTGQVIKSSNWTTTDPRHSASNSTTTAKVTLAVTTPPEVEQVTTPREVEDEDDTTDADTDASEVPDKICEERISTLASTSTTVEAKYVHCESVKTLDDDHELKYNLSNKDACPIAAKKGKVRVIPTEEVVEGDTDEVAVDTKYLAKDLVDDKLSTLETPVTISAEEEEKYKDDKRYVADALAKIRAEKRLRDTAKHLLVFKYDKRKRRWMSPKSTPSVAAPEDIVDEEDAVDIHVIKTEVPDGRCESIELTITAAPPLVKRRKRHHSNRNARETTGGRRDSVWTATQQRQEEIKRILAKHTQQPVKGDQRMLYEGDLDYSRSEHTSYMNFSKIPTESDEDMAMSTKTLRSYLHENFWLHNEDPQDLRVKHARTMKKYMDFTTDPCNNFFEYSCGNWHKFNPIPSDRNSYNTFDLLRENLDYVLKYILDEDNPVHPIGDKMKGQHPIYEKSNKQKPYPREQHQEDDGCHIDELFIGINMKDPYNVNPKPVKHFIGEATDKAQFMYKSCVNIEMLQTRGIRPALKLLLKLGGWPLLDPDWSDDQFNLELLLAQLRLFNNDVLISEWVGPSLSNSNEYVIQLDQTTLGLPDRDYYLDSDNIEFLEAYEDYIIAVGTLMGASADTIEEDAQEIIAFETELADITYAPDERTNASEFYVRLTVHELRFLSPHFDWLRYFRLISNGYISDDDDIVLYCLDYIERLMLLLARTPARTTTNYVLWRFMRHRVNNLDDRFLDAKLKFHRVLFGRENEPPRWQHCVMQVNANMGMAVGRLFINKYYNPSSKLDTLRMTRYLRDAFADILTTNGWLDATTTELALIKLFSMRLKIGYPNNILDTRRLNKRYKDVRIHPNYYFENTLSVLQHLTRIDHYKLRRSVNKEIWPAAPVVVNAYYSRNKNQMVFPAGILQPPFYHRHFPKSMNFGGIGVVMGHEITHGFDNKGRLFDKGGNLKNWWKDESVEEFEERSQCLIDQYNRFMFPIAEVLLDGQSTEGENIADNGGLKQAFTAYHNWLYDNEDMGYTETLPGLNLTNFQLFFVNFAQVWCGDMRADAAQTKIRGAVHSPGRFRVIGAVSNSDEFAAAFDCPQDSPMNPPQKCTIW